MTSVSDSESESERRNLKVAGPASDYKDMHFPRARHGHPATVALKQHRRPGRPHEPEPDSLPMSEAAAIPVRMPGSEVVSLPLAVATATFKEIAEVLVVRRPRVSESNVKFVWHGPLPLLALVA